MNEKEKSFGSDFTKVLDSIKESTSRSKDYYKFVIGLSTGALVFSVTFIEKFTLLQAYKPIILIGWVCLIISIISGVWLLPKKDSFEAQLNAIRDTISNLHMSLLSIEQDFNKFIERSVIDFYLKHEMSKESKDEEQIKKLKKDWAMANGGIAKGFYNIAVSKLEEINPTWPPFIRDLFKEIEAWKPLLSKSVKLMYIPNMSKQLRKTIVQVNWVEKVMTGFFYAGIILITLSSAINFLKIDVVGIIRRLFVQINLF